MSYPICVFVAFTNPSFPVLSHPILISSFFYALPFFNSIFLVYLFSHSTEQMINADEPHSSPSFQPLRRKCSDETTHVLAVFSEELIGSITSPHPPSAASYECLSKTWLAAPELYLAGSTEPSHFISSIREARGNNLEGEAREKWGNQRWNARDNASIKEMSRDNEGKMWGEDTSNTERDWKKTLRARERRKKKDGKGGVLEV